MMDISLVYEASLRMCADIFTKAFSNAVAWRHACDLIQITDLAVLSKLAVSPYISHEAPKPVPPKRGGGGYPTAPLDRFLTLQTARRAHHLLPTMYLTLLMLVIHFTVTYIKSYEK